MNTAPNLLDNDLIIDDAAISHLKEAAVWGKFLGIMGFVYSIVIALSGIFTGIWSRYSQRSNRMMQASLTAMIYLVGAAIIFFMSLYLFRFAKKIQVSILSNNQQGLSDAFRNLKLYFRFAGIISIIALMLTVLAIVGMMLAATFSRY